MLFVLVCSLYALWKQIFGILGDVYHRLSIPCHMFSSENAHMNQGDHCCNCFGRVSSFSCYYIGDLAISFYRNLIIISQKLLTLSSCRLFHIFTAWFLFQVYTATFTYNYKAPRH